MTSRSCVKTSGVSNELIVLPLLQVVQNADVEVAR